MSVTLQGALAVALVPHTLLAEGLSCFVFLFIQISNSWILAELTWTLYGSPASQPGWAPVLCQISVLATAHGPGAKHWDHLQQQWQAFYADKSTRSWTLLFSELSQSTAHGAKGKTPKHKDPKADPGWGHVATEGSNISKTPKPQQLSAGSASFPCLQPPLPAPINPEEILTASAKGSWHCLINMAAITRHCQTTLSVHTHQTETNDKTPLLAPLPQSDSSGWAGSAGKAGGFSLEEYPSRSALKPKQYFNRKQFLFLPSALTKLNLLLLELWTGFQLPKLQFLRPQQHQGTLPGGSQRGMFQHHYGLTSGSTGSILWKVLPP